MIQLPPLAAGVLGIEHFTPPWDVFFLPLFNGLIGLYHVLFSDLALALIVFTVVIRTILAPLFVRQIRSQREMQRMQPLIKEVQRKYKGDRQKITAETMALYKEHGVNPAAGCLPVLVQLPILFALYQALIRASGTVQNFAPNESQTAAFNTLKEQLHLVSLGSNHWQIPVSGRCDLPELSQLPQFLPLNCQLLDALKLGDVINPHVPWLFNLNLADIDHVFSFSVFGGFVISGLAVLAALLQFVQVKMTQPNTQSDDPTVRATGTMTYLFPIMTIVWGGVFPAGLILYWVVYTAYLIGQQYVIMGWGNLFPLFGWSPFGPSVSASPAIRAGGSSEPTDGGRSQPRAPDKKSATPAAVATAQNPRRAGSQRRRRGRKAR